jgi:hypothetical protein
LKFIFQQSFIEALNSRKPIKVAETGLSLRMRNLVSLYEKADIRLHATLSTAANGSKEHLVTFLNGVYNL